MPPVVRQNNEEEGLSVAGRATLPRSRLVSPSNDKHARLGRCVALQVPRPLATPLTRIPHRLFLARDQPLATPELQSLNAVKRDLQDRSADGLMCGIALCCERLDVRSHKFL